MAKIFTFSAPDRLRLGAPLFNNLDVPNNRNGASKSLRCGASKDALVVPLGKCPCFTPKCLSVAPKCKGLWCAGGKSLHVESTSSRNSNGSLYLSVALGCYSG